MEIALKRAYDQPTSADGYRVLVDRLWPRGIKKEQLALDEWCKDIAPSTELRKWFNHESGRFAEFRERYKEELSEGDVARWLLRRVTSYSRLTLVYAAKDPEINHARVLRDYLAENL